MLASLGSGKGIPLDCQIVQEYLPDLARNFAISSYRSSPGFDINELAQEICDYSTPNSHAPAVKDALQLIFHNLAKMHSTAGPDHVQRPLMTWLARSVVAELEAQSRRPPNFRQTLNRFRSLVAISNAFTSGYVTSLLYDFFESQYGIQICAACSRKAAFRFALLLFSLRLLPDADVLSAFRQIVRANPALFNRQVHMQRFANPRSADIWRLMEWVGGHWDADSFDGLPEGLSHILHSRRRPRFNPNGHWLPRPRPRPLSWGNAELMQRPSLQPRLYSTGSLQGRRSENALTDMANHMDHLDTRLASLENDHERVAGNQDAMVDYLNNSDRYDGYSDGDSDWLDKWV